MILIWAVVSVLLIAGVVLSGSVEFEALEELSAAEFAASGQARAVAEAGLIDAFAWLRRQNTQPVSTFAPRLDLAADPQVNETEDASVGLVRTFEVAPGLWGRYVVAPGRPAESFTDQNGNGIFDAGEPFTDANGDRRRTPGEGTRDVSSERGLPGPGTVWQLESLARLYRRSDRRLPLGVGPNVQIAAARMATEVRRLTIIAPASAALCNLRGDAVAIGTRARIRGSSAIAYGPGSGTPSTGGGEVPGSITSVPDYRTSIEDVFGVDWILLRAMADISTSDPVHGVPSPIPDYSLVVVSGDARFTAEHPLRGTAVVVVQGDCTIESGSNSFFNGVLYVLGNLTVGAPTYVRGTVICSGKTDARGSGGDYCELEHDPEMIGMLQVKMGQYRYTKSRYIPAPKAEDGRADESMLIKAPLDPILATRLLEDPPPGAFQVDDLMDAIRDLLDADPGSDGAKDLGKALDTFEEARHELLKDPANEKKAADKVAKAIADLEKAAKDGADVSTMLPLLTGGEGTLFEDMKATVERMIDEKAAQGGDVADAREKYDEALAHLAQGRLEETGGDSLKALAEYEDAAKKIEDAFKKLE